jgi:hypothetical protein
MLLLKSDAIKSTEAEPRIPDCKSIWQNCVFTQAKSKATIKRQMQIFSAPPMVTAGVFHWP